MTDRSELPIRQEGQKGDGDENHPVGVESGNTGNKTIYSGTSQILDSEFWLSGTPASTLFPLKEDDNLFLAVFTATYGSTYTEVRFSNYPDPFLLDLYCRDIDRGAVQPPDLEAGAWCISFDAQSSGASGRQENKIVFEGRADEIRGHSMATSTGGKIQLEEQIKQWMQSGVENGKWRQWSKHNPDTTMYSGYSNSWIPASTVFNVHKAFEDLAKKQKALAPGSG